MEQALGRNMYNLTKALESRVAANMVAVNVGSWLTNYIPLTQGGAQLGTKDLLRGMWQTLKDMKTSDGVIDASTFLTNRRGSDPLVRTWAQKTSAVLSSPMEHIDQFTAGSLVRARYNQNRRRGLSESEAMSEADSWAASVMADRSKGSTPTLFDRKNPITKLLTQFQLEVNNQLSYLFKDMAYQQQDDKCGDFEYCLRDFISRLLALLGIDDEPSFRWNRIANQTEETQMVLSAANYLDDEAVLAHLPWLTPEEAEALLKRKAAEEIERTWEPAQGEAPEGETPEDEPEEVSTDETGRRAPGDR